MESNKKLNIGIMLFYFAHILFLISFYMTKVTILADYIKNIRYISIFSYLISFFLQKQMYDNKTLIKIYLLVLLNFVVYFFSKDNTILILFLIVITSKKIKIDDIIKFDMYTKIIITLMLFVLHQFGFTNEYLFYRNGILRYSFGYGHPNTFGFVVASIFIQFIYLYRNKLKWYYTIPIIISMLIVNYYSDCRAAVVLLIITIICCFFKDKLIKYIIYNKPIEILSRYLWIFLTAITFLMVYLYNQNTEIGIRLNEVLSMRLKYITSFLERYNVTLFGNNLELVSTEQAKILGIRSQILDNAFINFLLRYGLVMFCLFSYYIQKVIKMAYKEKNTILIIVFVILIIYGITETSLFKPHFNIFLIFIREILYRNEKSRSGR